LACNRQTGEGGHGDNVIEISRSVKIPDAHPDRTIDPRLIDPIISTASFWGAGSVRSIA